MIADAGAGTAELMELAREVAVTAGRLAHEGRQRAQVAGTKTSEVDIVTEMDLATERCLIDLITRARPDDGVLGEEGGLRPGGSGLTWVIDPIDGTVNYLYGVGPWAVSVAVVEGEPDPATWSQLAGCVHEPSTGRAHWAGRGLGAFCDGQRLYGPPNVGLDRALIATGFGYLAGRRARQAQVLVALLPQVRDIRRLGSSALDLCNVAAGRVDGYYERGLNPWDHAAGGLVVAEAGAIVTGPHGRLPSAEMVVAGPPRLHAELLARLDDLDAYSDAV